MTGFSEKAFLQKYIVEKKDKKTGLIKAKFEDNFQTGSCKLLPFTLNPLSGCVYDGTCGLTGVAGEFYRIITQSTAEPIYSAQAAESILRTQLTDKFKMSEDDKERFIEVFKDVMFENDTLNVIDLSFFAYVPMKYSDPRLKIPKKFQKYRTGQSKIADYYVSIASECGVHLENTEKDLFCEVVDECLRKDIPAASKTPDSYFVMPYIKRQFAEDLKWLLAQNNNVVVKYLPLMLYFYASYSLMQTIMSLQRRNWDRPGDEPIPITYMLSSERASEGHPAVRKGWAAQEHFPETFLNRLSAYAQTLDILNSMFEQRDSLMTFHEILELFKTMEFDAEAKGICENVLNTYQNYKYELLDARDTERHPVAEKQTINISSYEDFVNKLLDLCITYQSVDYPRMKTALYSLVGIKMFEKRREHSVLVLDEDMLLLLVAMTVKGGRMQVDEMFKGFRRYGIDLSFQSRNAVSDYLQKLNLLERKSDSGEAQYVRIVL